jgi:hypothetical protein
MAGGFGPTAVLRGSLQRGWASRGGGDCSRCDGDCSVSWDLSIKSLVSRPLLRKDLWADSLLVERFTPYQLIVGTMTAIYALRNLDVLLGLGGQSQGAMVIACPSLKTFQP